MRSIEISYELLLVIIGYAQSNNNCINHCRVYSPENRGTLVPYDVGAIVWGKQHPEDRENQPNLDRHKTQTAE